MDNYLPHLQPDRVQGGMDLLDRNHSIIHRKDLNNNIYQEMKMLKHKISTIIFPLLILFSPLAFGAPPDAGQILNQERQPGAKLPDRLPQDIDTNKEQAPIPGKGASVLVKGFRFSGNEGIAADAELEALLSESIGKELEFSELQRLTEKVTNYLKKNKGFLLAKAYLPKQDITAGIIEIAIIAGRIDGKPKTNLKAPARIKQDLLEKIAGRSIKENEPVRMDELERAVLLISDLPGISSSASLSPGDAPGTTKVGIEVLEGPLLTGLVTSDNSGDRYTGAWRGTGQISVNDYLGLGDQLTLSVTGARDMYQGTAGYSLPVGSSGLRFSAYYTGLSYEVGREFKSLNIEGRADTLTAGLSYPVIRSRNMSISVNAGGEYISLRDEANNVKTSDRELKVGNLGVSASFFDSFNGGGLSIVSFSLYSGDLDLSDIPAAEAADAMGPEKSGHFTRATYNLARLQRFMGPVSLFWSLRGQIAHGNLDSSQKIIIGGPSGVRAYPVGEASGDEGHILTFETRYDVPKPLFMGHLQLVGFVDSGHVTLNKDPWPVSVNNITNKNNYWMAGAGAGIIFTGKELSLRASYAHKIGDNPGRSVAGNDSDNQNDSGRFWLQAVAWF